MAMQLPSFETCTDFHIKRPAPKLRIEPKKRSGTLAARPAPKLQIAEEPAAAWTEKAAVFVEWCHSQLMKKPDALDYVTKRGFTLESIARFKLGFNPKDFFRKRTDWGLNEQLKEDGKPRMLWLPAGLVIPTFASDGKVIKVKIRRTAWSEGDKRPKYAGVSGSKECPSIYGNQALPVALVMESELDALLVQQIAADLVYCVALGGSSKPLDAETDSLLKKQQQQSFSCPTLTRRERRPGRNGKRCFRTFIAF